MTMRQLGAQLGAASCATAGQDFATVAGAHALTEAVLLLALTLFGLIGTDHVLTPPDRSYY